MNWQVVGMVNPPPNQKLAVVDNIEHLLRFAVRYTNEEGKDMITFRDADAPLEGFCENRPFTRMLYRDFCEFRKGAKWALIHYPEE